MISREYYAPDGSNHIIDACDEYDMYEKMRVIDETYLPVASVHHKSGDKKPMKRTFIVVMIVVFMAVAWTIALVIGSERVHAAQHANPVSVETVHED